MNKDINYDVAVVGGGLAGLTMACRLGRAGVKTVCVDAAPANLKNNDLRTTAISYGSQKILDEAGIWSNLPVAPCPITNIEIFDGKSSLLLNFLIQEVANETGGEAFGWILLNSDLRQAMMKTLAGLESVTHLSGTTVSDYVLSDSPSKEGSAASSPADLHYVRLKLGSEGSSKRSKGGSKGGSKDDYKDGSGGRGEITAKLVIGADGRGSFTREWMGVRTRTWSYEQRAVICTVAHENPHENSAVEHFWPEGPFAILPMADGPDGAHLSSVVFTEHGPEKDSLMQMSEEAFELALAAKFPERYGDVRLACPRAAYPLNLVHAAEYIAPRMALVADAAHGIHPIAGQGLNLGFRDIKVLADFVEQAHGTGQDIGNTELLEEYQRIRRPDNMSMVAVTDGLNRLFSNNITPIRTARRFGLKVVEKLRPAKKFFMRQAMGDR